MSVISLLNKQLNKKSPDSNPFCRQPGLSFDNPGCQQILMTKMKTLPEEEHHPGTPGLYHLLKRNYILEIFNKRPPVKPVVLQKPL